MKRENRSEAKRGIRLKGRHHFAAGNKTAESTTEVLDKVIQKSLEHLHELRERGTECIEGTIFALWLTEFALEVSGARAEKRNSVFSPFEKPVAIYSFYLKDRKYSSLSWLFCDNEVKDWTIKKKREECTKEIQKLGSLLSSDKVNLKEYPSTEELLSILMDHLSECEKSHVMDVAGENIGCENLEGENLEGEKTEWKGERINKVHSARKSAIRNWEMRYREKYNEFEYGEKEAELNCYPIVAAEETGGDHLLLVMVSPLDANLVDEKVEDNDKCPEITLVIYKIENVAQMEAIREIVPLMKNSFGRVLFTNMLHQANKMLGESSDERASILRYWSKKAADGLSGILTPEQCELPFDSFVFCEAIVRNILCANIQYERGAEIYPFNRAYVFKAAGSSSKLSDEPIEMRVLEASVLSKRAEDRNNHLTFRERILRKTEDFECDPSKKTIQDKNCFTFYIHNIKGNDKNLLLSERKDLSEEQKINIVTDISKSRRSEDARKGGYLIEIPDEAEDAGKTDLAKAVYNLLGKLITREHEIKTIPDPVEKSKEYEVRTYSQDFEWLRLEILGKFSSDGLLYIYDQGIDLVDDEKGAPVLYQVQKAYQRYIEDRFKAIELKYKKDSHKQENMKTGDLQEIMRSYEEEIRRIQNGEDKGQVSQKNWKSKVVMISFSWELHDENTARGLARERLERKEGWAMSENAGTADSDSSDEEDRWTLLGKEYTFTIILVADRDIEKSKARLISEKEDLKLFFEMLMKQIWLDKKKESDYLDKRSRSMANSLNQLVHRTKELIDNGNMSKDQKKSEIDELVGQLRCLTQPRPKISFRNTTYKNEKGSCESNVFSWLAGEGNNNLLTFEKHLDSRARAYAGAQGKPDKALAVKVLNSPLPPMEVVWSEGVMRDAFNVVFKNAVEASLNSVKGEVTVQLQAMPGESSGGNRWFMDIVIENTGGPIPAGKLKVLNSADPKGIGVNRTKTGSTGLGVYLTRYQMKEVIRQGADVIYSNIGGDRVLARMRCPAKLLVTDEIDESQTADGMDMLLPHGEYILYVEDNANYYDAMIPRMRNVMKASGNALDICHSRSYMNAITLINWRMPLAVITDITVLRRENSSDSPAEKYGIDILKHLMKKTLESSKPPVWITSMDASLANINWKEYKYKKVDWTKENHWEVSEPRAICIFENIKNLFETPTGKECFEILIKKVSAGIELSHKEMESPGNEIEPTGAAIRINLEKGKFDRDPGSKEIFVEMKEDHDPVIVCQCECGTLKELAVNLAAWFNHEPLPDFDIDEEDELHELYSHMYHKRLLLNIVMEKKLFDRVPPQVFYWGLSRNLWFSDEKENPDVMAIDWKNIRNEDRGPMSALRHDVRNVIRSSGRPTKEFNSLERAINECENELSLEVEPENCSLKTQASAEKWLSSVIAKRSVLTSRKKAMAKIADIDIHILEIIQKDPELIPGLSAFQESLKQMSDYLGGQNGN